jgi:hypothetical protein
MPTVSVLPASTRPSGAGRRRRREPSAGLEILKALLGLGAMATALLGPLALGWIDYHVSSGRPTSCAAVTSRGWCWSAGGAGRRLAGRNQPISARVAHKECTGQPEGFRSPAVTAVLEKPVSVSRPQASTPHQCQHHGTPRGRPRRRPRSDWALPS